MAGRPLTYLNREDFILARRIRDKKRREDKKEKLKVYYKIWYENNREILKEKAIIYRHKKKEEIYKREKSWRDNNKDKLQQYRKTQGLRKIRSINPVIKFKNNIKTLIYLSFKRNNNKYKKSLRSEEILGCSIDFFREYILSKCPENTRLEDFGQYGYHIDHILPISIAETEEDIIKLCHYTNLQPLWWKDNLRKSNKIQINNELF